MTTYLPSGGTNTGTLSITENGTSNVGSASTAIINSGSITASKPAATSLNYRGDLTNTGTISDTPIAGSGSTLNMGSSSNTLSQTGGSLTFNALNATSGSTVNLNYGTINNDATSSIILDAAGANTFNASNVDNLTNAGTITLHSQGSTGSTSNWGGGAGATFNNTGTFSIDNSSQTSGSTSNFNFADGFTNSGNFSLNLPDASTANFNLSSGTLHNTGTMSITSHDKANGTNGADAININGNGPRINDGTINVTHADVDVDAPLTGTGTVNLSDEAVLNLSGAGTGTGQTFNFSGGNNTLQIPAITANSAFGGTIRGFSEGDTLDTNVTNAAISYNTTTGILTLTKNGNTYTYDIGKGYTGTFPATTNGGGDVTYMGATPCFLADTMIKTPAGPVAVQDLRAGDEVVTLVDGVEVVRPLSWVGSSTVAGRDLDTLPVRIARDAIAANVPDKDLLVTGDHCLFIDGKLIPARMLVNGRSIVSDATFGTYDVFHVELEPHAIVIADGMATESYLNTGRQALIGADGVVKGVFAAKTWADAAAPLAVSPETVEPIFRAIEARAIAQGVADSRMAMEFSHDADVHLVTDKGTVIRPAFSNGNGLSFLVPSSAASVRIVSRTFRPSVVAGPFVDDRRDLGVVVGNVTLHTGGEERVLGAHLTAETLEGWHGLEQRPARWTNGSALLVLGKRQGNGADLLSLQILGGGPYVVEAEDASPVRLSA